MRAIRRLRRSTGQVALEMVAVFGVWLICTTLIVNLMFYFASVMLMDSALNRAALQASSFGCLYTGGGDGSASGVTGYFSGLAHLGAHNVVVTARTPSSNGAIARPNGGGVGQPSSLSPNPQAYYSTWSGSNSPVALLKANANTPSMVSANCSSANPQDVNTMVPSGGYIVVKLTYDQNLWMFGSQKVTRYDEVISHSLQGSD